MKDYKLKVRNLHEKRCGKKNPVLLLLVQGCLLVVYYESCDERLKTKPEESTRLTYTGLLCVCEGN